MISAKAKTAIQNTIFEMAYEIEQKLSEDNFFRAKFAGVRPDQVSEVALKAAIKKFKKDFSE